MNVIFLMKLGRLFRKQHGLNATHGPQFVHDWRMHTVNLPLKNILLRKHSTCLISKIIF